MVPSCWAGESRGHLRVRCSVKTAIPKLIYSFKKPVRLKDKKQDEFFVRVRSADSNIHTENKTKRTMQKTYYS